MNRHHRANALAKAHRGLAAIELLVTKFIDDPDVPEVTDRLSGLYLVNSELVVRNSPAMWAAVGLAHDLHAGTPRGETEFRTSREFLFPLIAGAIESEQRLRRPDTGDVFAGLS